MHIEASGGYRALFVSLATGKSYPTVVGWSILTTRWVNFRVRCLLVREKTENRVDLELEGRPSFLISVSFSSLERERTNKWWDN